MKGSHDVSKKKDSMSSVSKVGFPSHCIMLSGVQVEILDPITENRPNCPKTLIIIFKCTLGPPVSAKSSLRLKYLKHSPCDLKSFKKANIMFYH